MLIVLIICVILDIILEIRAHRLEKQELLNNKVAAINEVKNPENGN